MTDLITTSWIGTDGELVTLDVDLAEAARIQNGDELGWLQDTIAQLRARCEQIEMRMNELIDQYPQLQKGRKI